MYVNFETSMKTSIWDTVAKERLKKPKGWKILFKDMIENFPRLEKDIV